jgi:uncharacterized membrane protein YdfJ with MMPL/SSD domain
MIASYKGRFAVIAVCAAAVTFLPGVTPATAFAKYSGGTGEPNEPYLIGSVEDLHAFANEPNDYGKHV